MLRPRMSWRVVDASVARLAQQHPLQRRYLTFDEFAGECGARPDDIQQVVEFLTRHHLTLGPIHQPARTIKVAGTLAMFERAFHTSFAYFTPEGLPAYRSHAGVISVPVALKDIVTDVIGFSDRRLVLRHGAGGRGPRPAHARVVARAYGFPPNLDIRGESIALIELGGGLDAADLVLYAKRSRHKPPDVTVIRVDGQPNRPASPRLVRKSLESLRSGSASAARIPDAFWATVEAAMDVQLVSSFAPGARIVVYLAEETPRGKFDAISAAVTDTVNQPDVISCSWGIFECEAPRHVMRSLDEVFRLAALRGLTVCASSGDFGDGTAKCGRISAHFPASSPHVLACGGTHLPASGDRSGEVVWSERLGPVTMSSGGGFSRVFLRPSWQRTPRFRNAGRGVPDVAGKADVAAGYSIIVRGVEMAMGGTSAVAPLWASLAAIAKHRLGRPVGLFAPLLYAPEFATATRRIRRGSNGAYRAGPGWNPCTGLGSPNAGKLLRALTRKPPAAGSRASV